MPGGSLSQGPHLHRVALVPRRSPETIFDVDEAMKDGYGWSCTNSSTRWARSGSPMVTANKIAVPALVKLAAEKGGFYRTEGTKLQYLTTQGTYTDVVRLRRAC